MQSPQLVQILAVAVALLSAGYAQENCAGLQGPPGKTGLPGQPGPKGRPGEKGIPGPPGLSASQDPKLQSDLKKLQHRITRMERALTLNGKLIVAGEKVFASTGETAEFQSIVAICKGVGGSIASPANKKENDAVRSFVEKYDSYAYLGITEGHIPGHFHFLDGAPVNFTNWYGDEPTGKGSEKCVEMYNDGTWNDKLCDKYRLVVCEF